MSLVDDSTISAGTSGQERLARALTIARQAARRNANPPASRTATMKTRRTSTRRLSAGPRHPGTCHGHRSSESIPTQAVKAYACTLTVDGSTLKCCNSPRRLGGHARLNRILPDRGSWGPTARAAPWCNPRHACPCITPSQPVCSQNGNEHLEAPAFPARRRRWPRSSSMFDVRAGALPRFAPVSYPLTLSHPSQRLYWRLLMRLEGKVALVTGSSSGIGKAVAIHLGREGCDVCVDYYHDELGGEDTRRQIEVMGRRAIAVKANVSHGDDVRAMVQRCVEELGGLDIMVNNAGVEIKAPITEVTEEHWDLIIGTTLKGVFLGLQTAARHMVETRRGRIINISSIHEEVPMPRNAPYCAAKGGVAMLMRTAAVELAPYGI